MRLELRGTSRNRERREERKRERKTEKEGSQAHRVEVETESTDSTFFSANRLLN